MNRISRRMTGLLAISLGALLLGGGAAAQVRTHTLRAATTLPDDHPVSQGTRKFAELVAAKSGKKMKVRVYTSSSLGSDVQLQGALQGGTLDFAVSSTTFMVGMVKEFSVIDMPFMFRNAAEADAVLDGPIGRDLAARLEPKGLRGLAYMEQGFRHTTSSRQPVNRWEDFQGQKIRVQSSAFYVDMFNALGANAIPMAINEVYTAMETKAIDGHENSLSAIHSNRFHEVQKYLSMTGHSYNTLLLLVGGKSWERLNADERKIIAEAAREAALHQRKLSRDLNDSLRARLQKEGMVVNDVSDAEKQRLADKLQPVVDKYAGVIGGDWLQRLNEQLAKMRK